MSKYSEITRKEFGAGDAVRDRDNKTPEDILRIDSIGYKAAAPDRFTVDERAFPEQWNLLDIYRPKALPVDEKLPVIVNVHGGGWVYGDKEVYQFYGMSMAQHGFAFVNPNYRLSPESQFPAHIIDVDDAMQFVRDNADKYGLDTDHVFMVGDSAGGHLAALYGVLLTNPEYRERFEKKYDISLKCPLKVTALGLNCGIYDLKLDADKAHKSESNTNNLMADLFGDEAGDETFMFASPNYHLTADFPPAYVMAASRDFLNYQAPMMQQAIEAAGGSAELHIYGDDENLLYHVFHCDMKIKDGAVCNADEARYFKGFLG